MRTLFISYAASQLEHCAFLRNAFSSCRYFMPFLCPQGRWSRRTLQNLF